MDSESERNIQEKIEQLLQLFGDEMDLGEVDPVVKMMLVALCDEVRKIKDYVDMAEQRIVERYCSDFIPYDKVGAVPAIALLNPKFRNPNNDTGMLSVGSGALFTSKNSKSKSPLNFFPLFATTLLPCSDTYVLTSTVFVHTDHVGDAEEKHAIRMEIPGNELWVGVTTPTQIDCMQGVSFLIEGTGAIQPEHIFVGVDDHKLEFTTMQEFENIEMLEPFDAQQASGRFFAFINAWKQGLLNMEDASLIYITDAANERDFFKLRPYPRAFKWLEDEKLNLFKANTLWLKMVFPDGYDVPDGCRVTVNILPVVNVDVNTLTLTPSAPIAKLQKDNSFFLQVLETSTVSQRQGYGAMQEDILIRDFDASCYNSGDLYRDVYNLYNRFVDDYHAFEVYNGLKDGEVLKQLREAVNKIQKSVTGRVAKDKFNSGIYAMKKLSQNSLSTSVRVSYLTTQGLIGNTPMEMDMENRKLPAIKPKAHIIVAPMCGADKASADERYELLRYYSLTNDRLYTKADIEAFLRKELMSAFGKDEFRRIFVRIRVEGAGGPRALQRGLYIDIEFKDRKNYSDAVSLSFDKRMRQKIGQLSCIAMPVIVSLINLEE